MVLDYVLFENKTDRIPKARQDEWPKFKSRLWRHVPSVNKDGKLFSPCKYGEGQTRGNDHVVEVTMLVLDFDDGTPYEDFKEFWRDLEHVAYSTYSHTPEHPKWRAVFPLLEPCPGKEWSDVYERLHMAVGKGVSDPSCKDPARIYYTPSCPPDRTGDAWTISNDGLPLAWRVAEHEPEPPAESLKPGEDFEARATVSQILEPHGWTLLRKRGEQEFWVRPGKNPRDGHSAIYGPTRHGYRFYCFSSSVPFHGRLLTKFGLYAEVEHGGDWRKAASELRSKGYGRGSVSQSIVSQIEDREGAQLEPGKFHTTDLGNAERLVAAYGHDLKFCHLWGKWLVWDGRRWAVDETGEAPVKRLAHRIVRQMQAEAAHAEDPDTRQRLAKWAFSCEAKSRIDNMVAVAKTLDGIATTPDDLDKDPWLLNCKNGTLDLRTGELRKHNRSDAITLLVEHDYDEHAQCKTFQRVVFEAMREDVELGEYLWRFLGSCLAGVIYDQVFGFWHGNRGNNGKSTVMGAVEHVLGGYACECPTETLMARSGDSGLSNDIARLKGKRLIVAPETEDGKRLNEGLIKRLTGGDTIAARFLHQEFFEFRITGKIVVVGNHKPTIRGTDDAIWRRVHLVPWENVVPEDKRDSRLPEKLEAEAEGILAWLVSGCMAWQRDGLKPPNKVVESVNEYRQESDTLGAFLGDATVERKYAKLKASKLFGKYQEWCKQNNEYPLNLMRFGRALNERGVVSEKTRDGIMYLDLELSEEWEDRTWSS